MSAYFNGEKIKELYFNGKKIAEAYFNGKKVYSGKPLYYCLTKSGAYIYSPVFIKNTGVQTFYGTADSSMANSSSEFTYDTQNLISVSSFSNNSVTLVDSSSLPIFSGTWTYYHEGDLYN
jgi:hypothetical protein